MKKILSLAIGILVLGAWIHGIFFSKHIHTGNSVYGDDGEYYEEKSNQTTDTAIIEVSPLK